MTDLDQLVTRMTAAGAQRVYKVNAVPSVPAGSSYAVLALDTGTPVNRRAGGAAPSRRRYLTAQLFSPSEAGVMDMAGLADAAFDAATLTELPGEPFCVRDDSPPIGPIRDPDVGGLLYVLHLYRF